MFESVRSPEELGLSSKVLLQYLDEVKKRGLLMHSMMILKDGKLAARLEWKPYDTKTPHMLFSLSKSFTSLAAGFCVAEGLFAYDTPILKLLPDKAPAEPSEWLRQITIHDLLCMGSGLDEKSDFHKTKDWAREALSYPVRHKPGTHFHYNSHGTYLVSAAVQRVTGMTVRDYLMPRLFTPLGIEQPHWDSCPQGVNCGGWGLHLSCESIAKFGQLLLQHGMWEGARILPEGWVETATSYKIANDGGPPDPNNEWAQGYCYQFWRTRGNRYRGDGMYGQVCMVDEARGMVIAATAGVRDMGMEFQAMHDFVFPALGAKPGTEADQQALRRRIAELEYPFPRDEGVGPLPEGIYVTQDGKESVTFKYRKDGALRLMGRVKRDRANGLFGPGKPVETLLRATPFSSLRQPMIAAWGREKGKLHVVARMPQAPFILDALYTLQGDTLVAQIDSLEEPPREVRYVRKETEPGRG
ncbi:MAG: serine hydrolase [Clostridiales bacterium]|nr:serine hydrolase [Clostridiales bacterium]